MESRDQSKEVRNSLKQLGDNVGVAVEDSIEGDLTDDEIAVILEIRETDFGLVEVSLKEGRIVSIATRKTHLPPSLEGSTRN